MVWSNLNHRYNQRSLDTTKVDTIHQNKAESPYGSGNVKAYNLIGLLVS